MRPQQIRITHVDAQDLISPYLTNKYMIFEHNPAPRSGAEGQATAPGPNRRHYHIYIFDPKTQPKAIREYLQRHGLAKTDYIVAETCGKTKEEITPLGAYRYGTAPTSYPRIVEIKGFTQEELKQYKEASDVYYAQVMTNTRTERITYEVTRIKPDLVWTRFYEKMLRTPDTINWTERDFRRWIIADYLTNCKPRPREADLSRYAWSLHQLKDKRNPEGYTFTKEEIPV